LSIFYWLSSQSPYIHPKDNFLSPSFIWFFLDSGAWWNATLVGFPYLLFPLVSIKWYTREPLSYISPLLGLDSTNTPAGVELKLRLLSYKGRPLLSLDNWV
jgi:hypothetical protein